MVNFKNSFFCELSFGGNLLNAVKQQSNTKQAKLDTVDCTHATKYEVQIRKVGEDTEGVIFVPSGAIVARKRKCAFPTTMD